MYVRSSLYIKELHVELGKVSFVNRWRLCRVSSYMTYGWLLGIDRLCFICCCWLSSGTYSIQQVRQNLKNVHKWGRDVAFGHQLCNSKHRKLMIEQRESHWNLGITSVDSIEIQLDQTLLIIIIIFIWSNLIMNLLFGICEWQNIHYKKYPIVISFVRHF